MDKKQFERIVDASRKRTKLISQFRDVMDFYNECKENASSIGSVSYENSGSGTGYVVGKVVMSSSDFVSDVEITAKRVLGPKQYIFFKALYLAGQFTTTQNKSDAYKLLDIQVQELMGEAFKARGLHPVSSYMQSKRK